MMIATTLWWVRPPYYRTDVCNNTLAAMSIQQWCVYANIVKSISTKFSCFQLTNETILSYSFEWVSDRVNNPTTLTSVKTGYRPNKFVKPTFKGIVKNSPEAFDCKKGGLP